MASIMSDLQKILDMASQYSKDSTLQMRERHLTCVDLAQQLTDTLDDITGPSGMSELDLRVQAGGQEGYVSPYPWVRVYSKRYAPSAQHGIYLVYLFAADGSRAYLSLNQGTSVPKPGGGMRTTTDTKSLLFRTAQARSALGDHMEAEGAADAMMSIDLAWQALQSADSRYKGRAYEAANILAHEYRSGQIPAEEQLQSDLINMLPLLAELYDATFTPTDEAHLSGLAAEAAAAMTKKRLLDPETRKKIELWAEDDAYKFFTERKWQVKRVGSEKRGYDLECIRDGQVLHVEVKGTQTTGEKVVLTGNEVDHVFSAKCNADHALYVVSGIKVSRGGEIKCSGGVANRIRPWAIEHKNLITTQYSYSVPPLIEEISQKAGE